MRIARLAACLVPFFLVAQSPVLAADPCRTDPTTVYVLDKARMALNGFAAATTPPASMLWGDAPSDQYDRDEAVRIIRDVHGDVATGYAAAGEAAKAQEALSAIGDLAAISERLDSVIYAAGNTLDPSWLRTTLTAAAKQAYPFGKPQDFFDDDRWQQLLSFAGDYGLDDIVKENFRRATAYAAGREFAGLSNAEQDKIRISLLTAALVAGDVAEAEGWLKAIETEGQAEYGRMKLGERRAAAGDVAGALRYGDGMIAVRRSAILSALVVEAARRSDLKAAEKWLSEIGDDDEREFAVEKLVNYGLLFEAQALARNLPLGSESRIQIAVIRDYIDQGQLPLAGLVAERVHEVGERAVGFAVLAIAAARAGKIDLVVHAEDEILRMRTHKVDAGQIADSEIIILYAYEALGKTDLVKARLARVRSDIAGVTGDSYPDDPVAALGASEEQINLYIHYAGVLMAAGLSDDALNLIVRLMGNSQDSQADLIFVMAEAAGLAYGLTNAELGRDPVCTALAKIEALPRPFDRALMLSHLARSMQLVPRNF